VPRIEPDGRDVCVRLERILHHAKGGCLPVAPGGIDADHETAWLAARGQRLRNPVREGPAIEPVFLLGPDRLIGRIAGGWSGARFSRSPSVTL
jgi:hypothetical protein